MLLFKAVCLVLATSLVHYGAFGAQHATVKLNKSLSVKEPDTFTSSLNELTKKIQFLAENVGQLAYNCSNKEQKEHESCECAYSEDHDFGTRSLKPVKCYKLELTSSCPEHTSHPLKKVVYTQVITKLLPDRCQELLVDVSISFLKFTHLWVGGKQITHCQLQGPEGYPDKAESTVFWVWGDTTASQ
nr:MAG: hypothetical protein [Wufeng shrew rhabdovirus 10]